MTNSAGWIIEFLDDLYALLSADRKHGGHVLEIRAKSLQVSLHSTKDLHLVLPEKAAFLHADLNSDPAAALAQAEGAHPHG